MLIESWKAVWVCATPLPMNVLLAALESSVEDGEPVTGRGTGVCTQFPGVLTLSSAVPPEGHNRAQPIERVQCPTKRVDQQTCGNW